MPNSYRAHLNAWQQQQGRSIIADDDHCRLDDIHWIDCWLEDPCDFYHGSCYLWGTGWLPVGWLGSVIMVPMLFMAVGSCMPHVECNELPQSCELWRPTTWKPSAQPFFLFILSPNIRSWKLMFSFTLLFPFMQHPLQCLLLFICFIDISQQMFPSPSLAITSTTPTKWIIFLCKGSE